MPASITAIVFDFDGVLADTERLHLRAFQEVFDKRGWSLEETVYFDRYLGYDDEGLVSAFAVDQQLGLTRAELDALATEKEQVFAGYLMTGSVLYPDAKACVERLAREFSLGIASGALKSEITHILSAANLLHHFPVIVAADDVTECKPAPEPYLKAAGGLGIEPSRCVAIEDSGPGLTAANAAGMRTIGLTTTSPRQLLTHADIVLDRLDEITTETVARLGR